MHTCKTKQKNQKNQLPPQYTKCNNATDCVDYCGEREDCCCVWSNHPEKNWCGWQFACNDWGRCLDPNGVVFIPESTKDEIKIYENKNGDEVIETGNVRVSVAQDGTEKIEILSHNNNNN